jgi:uncharacterized protein (DUF1800 family)
MGCVLGSPDQSASRLHLFSLLLAMAVPAIAYGLDAEDTRHLLDRTGFGARPQDTLIFASLNRATAVERVLRANASSPQPPPWAIDRPFPNWKHLRSLPEEEQRAARQAYQRQRREQTLDLRVWWYQWMLDTEAPLIERMTLFWHNHFTSELRKVRSPQLMLQQNQLFRRHALGNYGDLLRDVLTDPAMLIYLDGKNSHKAKPNENLARELLELFTLGEGHYSEADVRNLARALTGWTVDHASGSARFRLRNHDDGEKSILGKRGHWGVDGVITILLAHPRTAILLVEKLWLEFVSPDPEPAEVRQIAKTFRANGYEIRPALRELLLTDAFWAEQHRGVLIKSPVELIVGTLRRLDLPLPPDRQLIRLARAMGQDLFQPPDVKGWRGHTQWIDTDRLLARERFLKHIRRNILAENAAAGTTLSVLAAGPAVELFSPFGSGTHRRSSAMDAAKRDAVRGTLIDALLDPAYQLK